MQETQNANTYAVTYDYTIWYGDCKTIKNSENNKPSRIDGVAAALKTRFNKIR